MKVRMKYDALVLTVTLVCGVTLYASDASEPKQDVSVFNGPNAPSTERLADKSRKPGDPLRTLVVEERVGIARQSELVRVPLFLHDGECDDVNSLEVRETTVSGESAPISYQADDIRRDKGGHISRMHIYFETNLAPWERKRFVLRRGYNSPTQLMKAVASGDEVTFEGQNMQVTFYRAGPKAGRIAAIKTDIGKVQIDGNGLYPHVTLVRQSADTHTVRSESVSLSDPGSYEIRDLRWAAGPLFCKFLVRIGPPGLPDNAEYIYMIPRYGREFTQQEILFPSATDDPDVVGAGSGQGDNVLLAGRLHLGEAEDEEQIVRVPTGLRLLTRSVNGHADTALVNKKSAISLFPVPYVELGVSGMMNQDGAVTVMGCKDFHRTVAGNSHNIRQFWAQTQFVFSHAVDVEDLWEQAKLKFQPLVAIVDEPEMTNDDLNRQFSIISSQFSGISWGAQAGLLYVQRKDKKLQRFLALQPTETENELLEKAHESYRDVLQNNKGIPFRQDQIARSAGPLDAYSITQSMAPWAFLAAAGYDSIRLTQDALTVAQASRIVNGKVNEYGFPYINCFYSAFNMQGGSIILGLYAGKKTRDLDLVQYYRDVARSSNVLDIYGHGQRTYESNVYPPGNSDLLYEGVSDFWLRSAAILANEDLWQHPAIFGRYFDAIDVNTDIYDRTLGPQPEKYEYEAPGRPNMFRTQTQDHRWDGWLTSPYLGFLEHPEDGGRVGLTDAVYFARSLEGHWINWPDANMIFQADIEQRILLSKYAPESGPPLPANVRVENTSGGNRLRWDASSSPNVIGYRIYRADTIGGPITFVNSPYWPTPGKLAEGTTFLDIQGRQGQVYFVTAVDSQRRESKWFPNEPPVMAGTKTGNE